MCVTRGVGGILWVEEWIVVCGRLEMDGCGGRRAVDRSMRLLAWLAGSGRLHEDEDEAAQGEEICRWWEKADAARCSCQREVGEGQESPGGQ